jgi:hypothetical protein
MREREQRGLRQSLQQGETRLLLRQFRQRFGEPPAWVTERLAAAAEPEQLEQWEERVLAAPILEVVFGVPSEPGH